MSEKFFPTPNRWIRFLLYIWAAPGSMVGLLVGGLGLCSGGKCSIQRGCLEFHGGFVNWFLDKIAGGALAMTLGHTIVGQSGDALAIVRDHEQVHVRQYERWGPLFIPAYLIFSLVLWIRGRDFYRENPFEKEAFGLANATRHRRGNVDS